MRQNHRIILPSTGKSFIRLGHGHMNPLIRFEAVFSQTAPQNGILKHEVGIFSPSN